MICIKLRNELEIDFISWLGRGSKYEKEKNLEILACGACRDRGTMPGSLTSSNQDTILPAIEMELMLLPPGPQF